MLAVHSGAAAPGYGASDRVPELIAHMVYVDTGPATAALGSRCRGRRGPPALGGRTSPANENLDGLSEGEQLANVPQPGRARARPARCATRPSSRTARGSTCPAAR